VGQHAARVALADLAQPAPMMGPGGKVDFAGVLNRQHVAAGDGLPGLVAPALDQPIDRHVVVGDEAAESDFGGAIAGGQFSQANALAIDDRIEKLAPLLSRRRSPKQPKDDAVLWVVCGSGVVACGVSINMAALHPIRNARQDSHKIGWRQQKVQVGR